MFCPFCGNQFDTIGHFCPYCGEDLSSLHIAETKSAVCGDDLPLVKSAEPSDVQTEIEDLERELQEIKPSITVTEFDSTKDYWAELDALTGLNGVKESLHAHINNYRIQTERQRQHPDIKQQVAFNSIFLGNPGTGKTTVARLVAGILRQQGMSKGGQCVEVDATTLISAWVGASAKSAKLAALKAIDGVLFIDEAYALAGSGGGGANHGKDVIDALTPILENNRGRLVVIMAGYDKEMDDFLKKVNTGFASRFQQKVHFDDYNGEEMMTIFRSMVKRDHYVLSADADKIAQAIFQQIYRIRRAVPQFANARTVRNLFEKVCARASQRMAASQQQCDLDSIVAADLQLSKQEISAVVGLL